MVPVVVGTSADAATARRLITTTAGMRIVV
jgi:hypothetical protein